MQYQYVTKSSPHLATGHLRPRPNPLFLTLRTTVPGPHDYPNCRVATREYLRRHSRPCRSWAERHDFHLDHKQRAMPLTADKLKTMMS
jgi:hypothetical protein